MLLTLFIWSYLLVVFLNTGFAFHRFMRLQRIDTTILVASGMFIYTILASIWAIFGRINYEFQIALLLLQIVLFLKYQKQLFQVYLSMYGAFINASAVLKTFICCSVILVLLYASSSSSQVDNETYYIQTIKWLNEYGFVPGLANLHIFYAQTSGWHILQSAFSFSYFGIHTNDLNGFCMLLGIGSSLHSLKLYQENYSQIDLCFGLMSAGLLLLLPLTSAPSPDLAVLVFSIFLFDYFIKSLRRTASSALPILFIFATFIVYIKISAFPILLLPLFYLFYNRRYTKIESIQTLIICLVALALFVVKNTIISGYPLYPSQFLNDIYKTDFALPESIFNFWWNSAQHYSTIISKKEFGTLSAFEIFQHWLTNSNMHFILGMLSLLIFVVAPLVIRKSQKRQALWVIFLAMVTQTILLVCTTPQIRFLLPHLLFFSLLILSPIVKNIPMIKYILLTSLCLAVVMYFFPLIIGQNSHRLGLEPKSFSLTQLLYPNPNSNLNTSFSQETEGNLRYNSPAKGTYIWATGDGELPCINAEQVNFFETQFEYIPQRRGPTLANGFYSKKITTE